MPLKRLFLVSSLLVVLLGVLSAGFWFRTTVQSGDSTSRHAGSHSHSHANLEPVEASPPYPDLEVRMSRKNGERILDLNTTNFVFETSQDTTAETTKGHAHLHIDGESIAMFYDNRYVLPDFIQGNYELKVTLNQAKSHAPISVNGKVVSDTVMLSVDGSDTI